jgi:hypothetical protein
MKITFLVYKNVKDDRSFNPNNLSLENQYDFNHPFDVNNKIKLESSTNYEVCEFAKINGAGSSLHLVIDYNKIPDLNNFKIFINGLTCSNERIPPFSNKGILNQNDILEIVFKNESGTSLTHILIIITFIAKE